MFQLTTVHALLLCSAVFVQFFTAIGQIALILNERASARLIWACLAALCADAIRIINVRSYIKVPASLFGSPVFHSK